MAAFIITLYGIGEILPPLRVNLHESCIYIGNSRSLRKGVIALRIGAVICHNSTVLAKQQRTVNCQTVIALPE